MTQLLVSVRDAAEAAEAIAGGADLIDVKEPERGALGAADAQVWAAVRATIGPQRRLSVALGELDAGCADRVAQVAASAVDFAKVGLAGAAADDDWPERWRQMLDFLPPRVVRVAVLYADHVNAAAPAPRDVLPQAASAGCRVLLVDTFDKSSGGLFDHFSPAELERIALACRHHELQLALGGSLDRTAFAAAMHVCPDWIAVRRAACVGGRQGRVDRVKVAGLAAEIAALLPSAKRPSRSARP